MYMIVSISLLNFWFKNTMEYEILELKQNKIWYLRLSFSNLYFVKLGGFSELEYSY